ncbi:MFS transporter [Actinoalloteichus caeruleus]|uniref:MFS transporter n=1 Tax=Actinoalloteichus cyanogriseus TaxID=2893586 RepID=UPI00055527C2|nr:MFS transporter [Actinoalloteichus caeruleus]
MTRVALYRARQLSLHAVDLFWRAAHADGAARTGLDRLTYAVMANVAVDAAIAVALANTLFFSAAPGESRGMVALYLLITVAPFAVVAPVVGPALDRIQQGRRYALGASFAARALLVVVIALNLDGWVLYPAALGCVIMSKSFGVLRGAVTPRVLPAEVSLVRTNSRLTIFGLAAGAVAGALATGLVALFGSGGALWWAALLAVGGTALCLRVPAWVENTDGEVRATLGARPGGARQPLGRLVVLGLWGTGTARLLTGFLTFFAAFAIQATDDTAGMHVLMLALLAGAAGLGNLLGNAVGSRIRMSRPDQVVIGVVGAALASTALAAIAAGYPTALLVALVGATASALAKVSLDSLLQRELPEEARASAFGRSETVLQLSWVSGGALGLLLPPTYWVGFAVLSVLVAVGLTQTILLGRGRSPLPFLAAGPPVGPGSGAGPDHPPPANEAGMPPGRAGPGGDG